MLLQDYEVQLIAENRRQRKELIAAGGKPCGKKGCLTVKKRKKHENARRI